jgi:hypothetical protein
LNLNVLWVSEELENKIPIILEKFKIEVKKYLIEAKNSIEHSMTINIKNANKSQFNIGSDNIEQNN